MTVLSTPRWGTPYPDGNELISLGDDSIKNLALAVDDHTKLQIGTAAARPTAAAAKVGKYYLASDTKVLSLSDGTNWIEVAPGSGVVPIGAMTEYAGAGDPADTRFMLCDGRAISRTTYAALFAALGGASSPHGLGDGTTTFNIPDCRGRATVGPDNMGTAQGAANRLPNSNRALGQNGGAERHTHGFNIPSHTHTGNIPSHTHAGSAPDHLHGPPGISVATASGGPASGSASAVGSDPMSLARHAHAASAGNTGAADRGLSFTTGGPSATAFTTAGPSVTAGTTALDSSLPPYLVLNKIIRVS